MISDDLKNSKDIERLIKKYSFIVKNISEKYFLIGGEKEDLMQEGYIGLLKAIENYNNKTNVPFTAFARLCITRRIITCIKSSTRNKHKPLNEYTSLYIPAYKNSEQTYLDILQDNSSLNPEKEILNKEDFQLIAEIIDNKLSKLEKEAIKLYLGGLSYSEISDILCVNNKSIDNAIQRARKKIIENFEY